MPRRRRRPNLREARTGKVRATAARTLRVLVVEDSENDVMLLHRELRRGGYEPLHERVHTPEGMEEAWRAAEAGGEPFQVVISDYYMPSFGAPAALELLQRLDPGVFRSSSSQARWGRTLRWRS